MPSLLRIDASSRLSGSHSRALADALEAAWSAGFYTPPASLDERLKRAVALSDELIDELNAAETVLIATPMYNFSVPSALKSWIDQVVRINRTFSYDGKKFTGLVEAKRVVVVAAFGAEGYGGPLGF